MNITLLVQYLMNKIYKFILTISMYFTVTSKIPLSPISSLAGALLLPIGLLTRKKIFKFELLIILFLIYVFLSTLFFDPNAFLEFSYYRYDGNIWISYLPLFVFSFLNLNFSESIIKSFVKFVFFTYSLVFIYWLLTKHCPISSICSFPGLYEARNATGGFLSIVTTISFILWQNGYKKFKYVTLLLLIMLVLTFSRGSLLGLAASVFLIIILYKKNIILDKFIFISLFLLTIGVALFFYDSQKEYYNEAEVLSDVISSGTSTKSANILIRSAYLWPKSIDMISKNPIFGNGFSSFNDYGFDISNGQYFGSNHAHHTYLHFLAELGIVGLVIYLLFLLSFRKFWIKYRLKNKIIADSSYFSLLTVVFASFTEHRLTTPASMIIVSVLISLFVSYVRFNKNDSSKC